VSGGGGGGGGVVLVSGSGGELRLLGLLLINTQALHPQLLPVLVRATALLQRSSDSPTNR